MLVAAAVCPHPPLLVPGVAAGATGELDGLRAACAEVVGRLRDSDADLVVVVGAAERTGAFPVGAWGSLAGFGVGIDVGDRAAGTAELPLSLTVGRWLLDEFAPARERRLFGVPADLETRRCRDLGRALVAQRQVAMLVMGDGTGRRTAKPGYLDPRAEPFDDQVTAALAAGDVAALLGLDRGLADELLVGGVAAWQVLAGAAEGGSFRGDVLFSSAPYGVGYLVASWLPVERAGRDTGPGS
jgi:hypothetical protein